MYLRPKQITGACTRWHWEVNGRVVNTEPLVPNLKRK
jgi:hypothetical protein